jgi:hypothetical protein
MFGLFTYCAILFALSVGVWFRPAVGVAAVLCLYGLKQWGQSSSSFVVQHGQFTNYAIAIIALIGLIRVAFKRSCVFCQIPTATWLIAALLLYALLSVLWAPDLEASLQQWASQGPYIITITLLAPLLLSDFQDTRIAFSWTAFTGAAICILALLFGKWGFRGLLIYANVLEAETNPLALSSLAGTVFIISALSLGRPNSIFRRISCMVFIPITLAVILRSGSRGQLIAGVTAVMISLPIAFRMRNIRSFGALILATSIIVGLGAWSASLVKIDATRWESTDSQSAVSGRIENARHLLGAATSHASTIIFGLGNSSSFQILGIYPHITGLEVIAEEGVVGTILYLGIILVAARSIKRITNRADLTDSNRNVLAILTGLFVFEFILSWKQGSLLSSVYVFAYAITLGRLEDLVTVRSALVREQTVTPDLVRFPNLLR